ncbi:MAG: nucleotidyl transferase AbiEii/AbiGii toxin family protein [Chryseolinea sp.]
MLKNKTINMGVVKKVATALGELNDEVAYVGGATVSIYADDPIADDVRPTKDVDIMLRIATFAELAALQDKLASKNIYPDPEADINCRFKYDDVLIDVMSTKEVGWAPSDPWFEPGFKSLMKYKIDDEVTIRVFTAPYFLATKFSAFHDRGNDPRTSNDFEDIVYVLDSRLNIVDEIRSAPSNVRNYLKEQLKDFLNDNMSESISCHLSPFQYEERLALLRQTINSILA